MKKWTAIFLLVLTMLAPLSSLAQEDYHTVLELREQAPTRWTQTYETKWRTVEIDAEVRLPDTDTVPIVRVTYDVPENVPTAEESGWNKVGVRYDAFALYNGWKQAPKSVDGKRVNKDPEARETWYSGFAPDNQYIPLSSITYGEICDMLRENLTRFGYDSSQFLLETPASIGIQHWFQYGYKKDVLPGHLFINVRQTIHEIPVFQHIWSAVCDHYNGESRVDELTVDFTLLAGYDAYGEKLSHLYVMAAKPIETLAEDVPLCSFDKVLAAIEPEITAGHIRKIYEVELGYTIYNEPGLYFSRSEPLVEGRTPQNEMDEATTTLNAERAAATYYLRPMWQINCLWVKSPTGKLRETASYTTDERNSLDYYQLLVDAQTGELVQESKAQDRCEFKGFLSWKDVGQ